MQTRVCRCPSAEWAAWRARGGESDEKLERIRQDKSLRLTDASPRSRLTCVLSILASREPSTATALSAMFPEAATQPSRSLLWHTKAI